MAIQVARTFTARLLALLLCCVALNPRAGFAQESVQPRLAQLFHQAWGVREGVPGSVTSVVQTTDGYLWLANPSGLYRFDGVRFERYDLSANEQLGNPWMLRAASDGSLWIAHRSEGLSRLKQGGVTTYGRDDGLPPGVILDLSDSQRGTAWAVSDQGVGRFNGSQWETLGAEWGLPGRGARAILSARDGSVWIGSSGLYVIRPGATRAQAITTFDSATGTLIEAPDGTIWTKDSSGAIHATAADGTQLSGPPLKASGRRMLFDRHGALWLGLNTQGVQRIRLERDAAADTWRIVETDGFDASLGLTSDDVFDIFHDREDNMWVGTGGGLDLLRQTALVAAPLPRNFHGASIVAGADGSIWAGGATQPLHQLVRGAVSPRAVPPEISGVHVDRHHVVWVWSGVTLWRGVGGKFERQSPPPWRDVAAALAADDQDRLWVSFREHGLYLYERNAWRRADLARLPQKSGAVRVTVTAPDHRLWMAYRDGTVAIVQADQVTTVTPGRDGGPGAPSAMFVGERHAWIGGERGVAVIDGGRMRALAGLDAATLGRVKGVVEADDGSLWINADRGIVRVDAREVKRLLTSANAPAHLRVFDHLDGGIGGSVLTRPQAAIKGSDGRLWFVGFDNVVGIDPARIVSNILPPPVHVQSLRAGGRAYDVTSDLNLPIQTSNVQIRYTGLSLAMPERVRFRYMLEGLETEWQDAGTRREAFYTNLAPGHYTFRVIASNNDGVWNEVGASLKFTVPPAFYQTAVFRAAVIVLLAALTWVGFRLRLHRVTAQVQARLEERLSERERIARELHDTLLQGVHGLILKFQAIASRLPPGDATAGLIEDTLVRADHVLVESRDRVRDLRQSSTTGAELSVVLAQAGDDLARDAGIDFDVAINGEPRTLHPIVRDEAFWIGHEALLNAFHHSQANRIATEVSYGPREFRLRCNDDGQGMDGEILRDGGRPNRWGLPGMRERARRIGGRLTIRSRPGATEIDLRVPARMAYPNAHGSWWQRLRRFKLAGDRS